MAPLVSVIIPSYNHAPFVLKALNSVLSQTIKDLEVIVVDDGSTDRSPELIQSNFDPRIRSIMLGTNHGACAAVNIGIEESTAPYIALCNSDDEWKPEKLAVQLEILKTNAAIGAVFSDAVWIDEQGNEKDPSEVSLPNVFRHNNKSRGAWLKQLVEGWNCLCHPSVLIRREAYAQCGVYNNRYRQLPDYDMWLRLLERFEIFVLDQKLVRFRVLSSRENTSSASTTNVIRASNEQAMILRRFFDRVNAGNFAAAFGTEMSPDDGSFSLPLEKVLYLSRHRGVHESLFRDIAAEILYAYLEYETRAKASLESYGLSRNAFHTLMGISSPWVDNNAIRALTDVQAQASDAELAIILNSASWKVTKPLRDLKAYLRNYLPLQGGVHRRLQ